ncbi:MAG: hypothetical protein U0X91_14110 [Spirosomataceae bacterium]
MENRIIRLEERIDLLERLVYRAFDFLSIESNRASYYEFITDELVRRQLELDFIMMNKSPISDFHSYCQYALFQFENLLNYYFTLRFKDNDSNFRKYFGIDDEENAKKRVSEIPYGSKFLKFAKEFLMGDKGPTQLNHSIQHIAYVRHSTIHRNSIDIDTYENEILDAYVKINNINPSDRTKEQKALFSLGIKIDFKKKRNFDKVSKTTIEFINVIRPKICDLQI